MLEIHRGHRAGALPAEVKGLDAVANIVVWCAQGTPRAESVTRDRWQLLQAIRAGHDLARIAAECWPEDAPGLDVLLPTLVQKGWITDFSAELQDA